MKLLKIFILFIVVFSPNIIRAQQSKCEMLKESIIQGKNKLSKKIIASISDVDCDIKNTPLAYACYYGNIKIAKILLEKGANPNLMQYYNEKATGTPLFDALSYCPDILEPKIINPAEMTFKKNKKVEICKDVIKDQIATLLIEKGANVNLTSEDGTTTLMKASMFNRLQIIPLLIQKGVNINTQNNYGNTALIYSVDNSNYNIVKYLINQNANTLLKNKEGKTALDIAREKKQVEIILLLQ